MFHEDASSAESSPLKYGEDSVGFYGDLDMFEASCSSCSLLRKKYDLAVRRLSEDVTCIISGKDKVIDALRAELNECLADRERIHSEASNLRNDKATMLGLIEESEKVASTLKRQRDQARNLLSVTERENSPCDDNIGRLDATGNGKQSKSSPTFILSMHDLGNFKSLDELSQHLETTRLKLKDSEFNHSELKLEIERMRNKHSERVENLLKEMEEKSEEFYSISIENESLKQELNSLNARSVSIAKLRDAELAAAKESVEEERRKVQECMEKLSELDEKLRIAQGYGSEYQSLQLKVRSLKEPMTVFKATVEQLSSHIVSLPCHEDAEVDEPPHKIYASSLKNELQYNDCMPNSNYDNGQREDERNDDSIPKRLPLEEITILSDEFTQNLEVLKKQTLRIAKHSEAISRLSVSEASASTVATACGETENQLERTGIANRELDFIGTSAQSKGVLTKVSGQPNGFLDRNTQVMVSDGDIVLNEVEEMLALLKQEHSIRDNLRLVFHSIETFAVNPPRTFEDDCSINIDNMAMEESDENCLPTASREADLKVEDEALQVLDPCQIMDSIPTVLSPKRYVDTLTQTENVLDANSIDSIIELSEDIPVNSLETKLSMQNEWIASLLKERNYLREKEASTAKQCAQMNQNLKKMNILQEELDLRDQEYNALLKLLEKGAKLWKLSAKELSAPQKASFSDNVNTDFNSFDDLITSAKPALGPDAKFQEAVF